MSRSFRNPRHAEEPRRHRKESMMLPKFQPKKKHRIHSGYNPINYRYITNKHQ